MSLNNYARLGAALAGVRDVDRVGNSYLTSLLSEVNKSNVSNNGSSRTTRDSIDKNQMAIGNAEALRLSVILRLSH